LKRKISSPKCKIPRNSWAKERSERREGVIGNPYSIITGSGLENL
jgi:hypothetical protein